MIAVIGAGISGLSVAYHLHKSDQEYTVFEASRRPGGYLKSVRENGYLLEMSANSLLCNQDTFASLEELGLTDQIVYPKAVSKARFVYRDGRYRKLPAGLGALLFGDFFSLNGKLRILSEPFRKPQPDDDGRESLASFFRRRLGQEAVDYALSPFVAGIYAGDPERLLLDETFPQLGEMERKHGSLIKGFFKNKSGTGRKQSITFRDGLEMLPKRLAEGLSIQYETAAEQVTHNADGSFTIQHAKGEALAEAVVLSVPASVAASLLRKSFASISEALEEIDYPEMYALHSAFRKTDIGHSLDGFGGLHPKVEGLFTAGSIWSSSVFEERCPKGEVLLTTFVGGAQTNLSGLSPDAIQTKATAELRKLYGIGGEPVMQRLTHWPKAIPQYDRAIPKLRASWPETDRVPLYAAANWLDGVSLADAIRKGSRIAQQLATRSFSHT